MAGGLQPSSMSERPRLLATENRRTKNMKSLYTLAVTIPFATAMLFAQATQADKPSDQAGQAGATSRSSASSQADRPATQADRPAGQAGATSQTDRSSTSTQSTTTTQSSRTAGQADIGGRTYTGTIVNANCTEASGLSGGASATATSETNTAGGASTSARSSSSKTKSTE